MPISPDQTGEPAPDEGRDELYLVCDQCAHQWNAQEIPARCENCSAEAVVVCANADDQDERSAEVADYDPPD